MNREIFRRLLAEQSKLAPHIDFVLGLLRFSVRITITPNGPNGSQSQFGGTPMVPANFQWPEHAAGVYRFLGQINFSEIEERPASLPESGLLSLFYVDYDPESDSDEEIFWGDEGYVKAWYFEDLTELVSMASPHGKAVRAKRIALVGELDMPRHSDMRQDWPFDFDVLGAMLEDAATASGRSTRNALLATDYLLGYPSHYSLAYDPTPGPNWMSLLTLHSHEAFDWCWHDGDKLMVFIERDKLAARDFSELRCDAG